MPTLICFGDSITLGVRTGVTVTDTYCYKIGTQRGFATVLNKGVGGNTSGDGLARLSTDVLANNPKCVIANFGVNDVGNSVAVATYQSNMDSIVTQCQGIGAEIILLAPNLIRSTPYINAFTPYLDALYTIAHNRNVPLIDVYREFEHQYFLLSSTTFDALYMDYQHPSPTGHDVYYHQFLKYWNLGLANP